MFSTFPSLLCFLLLNLLAVSLNLHCYGTEMFVNGYLQVRWNKAFREPTILVIVLDDIGDIDFQPLLELLREIDASDIDAVDIITRSTCTLSGDRVILFLRAVSRKLRVVDLQDILFGKDFLLYVLIPVIFCVSDIFI